MKYFVYALRSVPTGRHYIGKTSDVERRLEEHNTKSGRWTSAFKSWELIAVEEFGSSQAASAREAFLKSRAGIVERHKLFQGAGGRQLAERP